MWTPLTIFFHFLYGTPLWYESTTDPCITNRGAVKVSRMLQTLLRDLNTFLSSHELQERYNVKTNFLVLPGLKSSLKSLRGSRSLNTTSSQSFLQSFLKAKKPTRVVYEKLVTIKQKNPSSMPGKMVGWLWTWKPWNDWLEVGLPTPI